MMRNTCKIIAFMPIKDRVKQDSKNSSGAWWAEHSVWVDKRRSLMIHSTKAVVGVSVGNDSWLHQIQQMYSNRASWRLLRHDSPPPFDEIGNAMPDRIWKTTRQKIDAKYNRNKKCRYDGVRPYCHISYECDLEKTSICLEPVMSWYFHMFDLVLIRNFTFP